MEIPVASSEPYTKRDMQEESDRAKANKHLQESRQRENRNKNPRAGGGGQGGDNKKKYKR